MSKITGPVGPIDPSSISPSIAWIGTLPTRPNPRHIGEFYGDINGVPLLPSVHIPLKPPRDVIASACEGEQWYPLNPSILDYKGALLCVIRLYTKKGETHHTANVIGRIDEAYRFVDARPMRMKDGSVCGYEDIRLCLIDEQLTAVAAMPTPDHGPPHSQMSVLTLDTHGVVTCAYEIQSPHRMEKNWSPVLSADEPLRLVYSTDPLVVMSYDERTHTCSPTPSEIPPLVTATLKEATVRGGSPLVPYRDGWLAVVHQVTRRPEDNWPLYTHSFVRFDHALTHSIMGRPWRLFGDSEIEFVSGLARLRDRWVIVFGREDRGAWLAIIDDETVNMFVTP